MAKNTICLWFDKEAEAAARFYAEVLRVMPDYREQYGWLKENGGVLMAMAGYAGPDGGPEDGI